MKIKKTLNMLFVLLSFIVLSACEITNPDDKTNPTVPTDLALVAKTSNSITISWSASTDDVGVTGYQVKYYTGTDAAVIKDVQGLGYTIGSLAPETIYNISVQALDEAGNESGFSAEISVQTDAAGFIDTEKPAIPTGLVVTAQTTNSISIKWNAATDNVGVVVYQVKYYTGNGLKNIVNLPDLAYTISGLESDTLYNVSVQALDAAGNESGFSAEVSRQTDPVVTIDTVKPTVPTALIVTAKTTDAITVKWNASTDNVGVTGYQLKYYTGNDLPAVVNVTGLTYTISNLKSDTLYNISVQALDAAKNASGFSVEISQKTDAATNIISGVTDGPYVFHRNGQVIVKYVANGKLVTRTFNSRAEAKFDVYAPGTNKRFSIDLKPSITIEPSVYTEPTKFLATSDIEGDFEAFEMLLKGAGVIDDAYNWTFGNGHLFISGDMFDRGTGVTEGLWLLYRLEYLAAAKGGKVHYVLGNHDVMNIIGDFRYVASKYTANMKIIGETLSSAYAADSELGQWIRSKNIVEKAGKFVFCHGGISPDVEKLNLTFEKMNDYGRQKLNGLALDNAGSIVTGGSTQGIYWYRGMTKNELIQSQVDSIATTFGFSHIVVGHTIFGDITPLYNSRVIAIDLDHSSNYYYGYMKGLLFENNSLYNLRTDGVTATKTLLQ